MKKLFKYLVILFLLWFCVHTIVIVTDGLRNDGCTSDVAVILGNKVNEDGTLSERLKARCDEGLRLYQESSVKMLLVSGGLGKEGFYEGDKMKEYLVSRGAPDSVIIVDNKGDNTFKTAQNAFELSKTYNFNSVTVVSQYYHITRTKMLFRKQGFTAVCASSPRYFEWRDAYSIFREFWAYYFSRS